MRPLAPANSQGESWFAAWVLVFVALLGLVGFFLALLIFFMAFMRTVAKTGWLQAVTLTAAAAAMILVLTWFLNMHLPAGLLQDHFYSVLPWPLN